MYRNLILCKLCEWTRNYCIKLVIIKSQNYRVVNFDLTASINVSIRHHSHLSWRSFSTEVGFTFYSSDFLEALFKLPLLMIMQTGIMCVCIALIRLNEIGNVSIT
jgi:hypothetical protein